MPQPDIILIEDDPLVGELARDILTSDGHTVLLVPESLKAVAAIREAMPKLIITDIMMPGISGMDICKTVKSDPDLKHIKIMVMSAKAFDVEKRRALALGAVYFLKKPFNKDTLSKTVKDIISNP